MCVAHVIYSFPPRCHCLALATSRFSPQEPSRELHADLVGRVSSCDRARIVGLMGTTDFVGH